MVLWYRIYCMLARQTPLIANSPKFVQIKLSASPPQPMDNGVGSSLQMHHPIRFLSTVSFQSTTIVREA